jgi:hypothetical protein
VSLAAPHSSAVTSTAGGWTGTSATVVLVVLAEDSLVVCTLVSVAMPQPEETPG